MTDDQQLIYRSLVDLLQLLESNLENVVRVIDRQKEGEQHIAEGRTSTGQIWVQTADAMAGIITRQQAAVARVMLNYCRDLPDSVTVRSKQWGVLSIDALVVRLTAWIEPDIDQTRQAFAEYVERLQQDGDNDA